MKPRSAGKPPKSPLSPQLLLPTSTRPPREAHQPSSPAKPLTLKRIAALYNELKTRDAKSQYPWRVLILVFLAFVALSITQFVASGIISLLPPVKVELPTFGVYQRYERMFRNDSDFAYIPEAGLFITTTTQAGSTTFWAWLHKGITGFASIDICNDTDVLNFQAPCWDGKVIHPVSLSHAERWRIVNSREVLRVAITRDPFERLISAWKAKAACDSDDYGTDVKDRDVIVPGLLRQAGIKKDSTCLSLNSFAEVVDTLRRLAERGEFRLMDMDKHFRPQECYFDEILYNLMLDVSELSNRTALQPIIKRLKFASLLDDPPRILHASRASVQTMSEATAAALYKFALLTESIPRKPLAG